jgi:hypothetical protein
MVQSRHRLVSLVLLVVGVSTVALALGAAAQPPTTQPTQRPQTTVTSIPPTETTTPSEPSGASTSTAERDGTAQLRGWIDIVLKFLGFGATAAGLFYVGFEYRDQRTKDRKAATERAEDRARQERERAAQEERARFLDEPRCIASLNAHLLTTGQGSAYHLDIEVEFESKSTARIDFLYGPDRDETVVEVFARTSLRTAAPAASLPNTALELPDPGQLVAIVPVDLGEVIDPDERSGDSFLIPLPQAPEGLIVYIVRLRVTTVQSARLEVRERDGNLAPDDQEIVEHTVWIFDDQVVVPGPGTRIDKSATAGPSR